MVEGMDYADKRTRVLLRRDDGLLFRVSLPKDAAVGAKMTLRANLFAPKAPDAVNGFDHARYSFFNGISAAGSATEVLNSEGEPPRSARDYLHFVANSKLVDSLVLGYKGALPRQEYDSIKNAGLAHIVAISGMHLALVGGWLLAAFSFIVKLFPAWTRRYPARNIALPLTAAGLALYLLISGASVSTIRAFAMFAAGFWALMLNRRFLTIRNTALVFLAMILANPFWLMTSGFQLSFAAVFGLIHFFGRWKTPGRGKVLDFFHLLFMSSAVATIWTFPFIAYHFGNFPIYSVFGNLLLLPIFSLGIMPTVMMGAIAAPPGWRFPLTVAEYLYDIMIQISAWLGSLPLAAIETPDIPPIALFLTFAGMFCYLIAERRRAAILFVGALAFTLISPAPVLRTSADLTVVRFKDCYNTGPAKRTAAPRKKTKCPSCLRGRCEYETKNWRAVSFQKSAPLADAAKDLCEYDFVISRPPPKLPTCPNRVVRGSVKIYEDGRIEKIRGRRWGLTAK